MIHASPQLAKTESNSNVSRPAAATKLTAPPAAYSPRPSIASGALLGNQARLRMLAPAALGNQELGRMLQAKLNLSEPADEYEQEADRVADHVLQAPSAPVATSARS